mmetsp:Transcript_15461/g.22435  ORF Transcript_15461/g.22435 Transcript_15461/m.22435 type:complete len:408 (+) Transcript_15461:29-1252(+)
MWSNISQKLKNFQYTVWTEFTPLAIKNNAVNLGQGFPAFKAPDFAKESLAQAAQEDQNQYSRSQGHPALTQAISQTYSPFFNRQINPDTEVVVTHGASEGIMCAFLGTLDEGDEVVMFDPSFDLYIPQATIAGGIPKTVPLIPPKPGQTQWTVDFEKFESTFNERTRAFIFNTPHNPIGKVFTHEELQKIAEVLNKWPNVTVISDEVYEHITFEGRRHLRLASYGDLWERSISFYSAGKLFSVTGWKTGWGIGGPEVVKKVATAHLWTTFCSNTPCQAALAKCLYKAQEPYKGFDSYYEWLRNEFSQKRTILKNIFENAQHVKVEGLLPEGGFFMLGRIDPSCIDPEFLENARPDFAFCRWMTERCKVVAIPTSAFFAEENKHFGEYLVRFALCKDYVDYEKASECL